MAEAKVITGELSIGELVSRTFGIDRREFVNYLFFFTDVEAAGGMLTVLAERTIIIASGAAPRGSVEYYPTCGAQLSSSALFCRSCGAKQPV